MKEKIFNSKQNHEFHKRNFLIIFIPTVKISQNFFHRNIESGLMNLNRVRCKIKN